MITDTDIENLGFCEYERPRDGDLLTHPNRLRTFESDRYRIIISFRRGHCIIRTRDNRAELYNGDVADIDELNKIIKRLDENRR